MRCVWTLKITNVHKIKFFSNNYRNRLILIFFNAQEFNKTMSIFLFWYSHTLIFSRFWRHNFEIYFFCNWPYKAVEETSQAFHFTTSLYFFIKKKVPFIKKKCRNIHIFLRNLQSLYIAWNFLILIFSILFSVVLRFLCSIDTAQILKLLLMFILIHNLNIY